MTLFFIHFFSTHSISIASRDGWRHVKFVHWITENGNSKSTDINWLPHSHRIKWTSFSFVLQTYLFAINRNNKMKTNDKINFSIQIWCIFWLDLIINKLVLCGIENWQMLQPNICNKNNRQPNKRAEKQRRLSAQNENIALAVHSEVILVCFVAVHDIAKVNQSVLWWIQLFYDSARPLTLSILRYFSATFPTSNFPLSPFNCDLNEIDIRRANYDESKRTINSAHASWIACCHSVERDNNRFNWLCSNVFVHLCRSFATYNVLTSQRSSYLT